MCGEKNHPWCSLPLLIFCRCKDQVSERHAALFAALEIDGAGEAFVTVKRAAGDSGNFLVVDDGDPILYDSHGSAYQGNVESLPFVSYAGLLGGWIQEPVDASGVMAGRLGCGVGFDLNFVASAQVDSAVGLWAGIELDMQLEVAEFGLA